MRAFFIAKIKNVNTNKILIENTTQSRDQFIGPAAKPK